MKPLCLVHSVTTSSPSPPTCSTSSACPPGHRTTAPCSRRLFKNTLRDTFRAPAHIATSLKMGTLKITEAPSVTGGGTEGNNEANCGVRWNQHAAAGYIPCGWYPKMYRRSSRLLFLHDPSRTTRHSPCQRRAASSTTLVAHS